MRQANTPFVLMTCSRAVADAAKIHLPLDLRPRFLGSPCSESTLVFNTTLYSNGRCCKAVAVDL